MALTAKSPEIVQAIGSYLQMAVGVAGGSGTSTVVTIPQFTTVQVPVVSGGTSTTAVYCDTISANTFTVTHASNDLFAYFVFGKVKL